MNMLLDPKTMFLSLGLGHLFTFILISAYWRNHAKDIPVRTFLMAKCAHTISWLSQAFRGALPGLLTLSISNSMLYIGASLEIISVLSLLHAFHLRTKWFYLIWTLLNIIGFHLILLYDNQEYLRIAYVYLTTAAPIILPVCRMIAGKTNTPLMKLMGYLYLLVMASSFVRGGVALLSAKASLLDPGISGTVSFLTLYLVMILGNTGFVLLLKERADQELIRLASYDDLTGALNRRLFTYSAEQAIADCTRKERPLSYLLFDIDRFKNVNDTYGHTAGDQVLLDITARVKRLLGENDLFVRYGGDEFGLLLPGVDEAASDAIAELIREASAGAEKRGLPVSYTISIGVLTVVPDPHTQLKALYAACDQALYSAKHSGRNGAVRGPAANAHTTAPRDGAEDSARCGHA
jgi:diguanylate cyclase (GGDEF)-like protein